jgi:predicted AAA+ superfamily ATPase
MISNQNLKPRNGYLNKLLAFKDTEPVKIITGIRRCGKSSLLKLMIKYLQEQGIEDTQILAMNFESMAFKNMTAQEFYSYVKEHINTKKRTYLFFDELQRIDGWEDAVNSFRVDFDCDIYITGSNAYLLSSEYATYLSGRSVEIKMLPLSFAEFLDFHGFKIEEAASAFGGKRKIIKDQNGIIYEPAEAFNAYLLFGGMPGIADIGLDQDKAMALLDGIYSTVVIRDILEREKRRGQRRITDATLLRKIILFLADNIGSSISATSMAGTLFNEGLLPDDARKGKPSTHTVQAYLHTLTESYFFYEIKRFDIKGKEFLRTLGKYYIVDTGLRTYLIGNRDRDRGHILENVVYLELLRRGYDLAVGKVDNTEVDFIATKYNEKMYIQVTESLQGEEVRSRELAPLEKIRDNYEKIVLSMDIDSGTTYNGIKALNIVNWLLEQN